MSYRDPIKDFVFEHGKEYEAPARFPADIMHGKVGSCFDTATLNVARHDTYRYVEGYAEHPTLPGIWVLHAWVTDGKHAYDPTWRQVINGDKFPVKTRYIGIEIPTEKLLAFMVATEYKSILANGWRDPIRANDAVPGLPKAHASDLAVKID